MKELMQGLRDSSIKAILEADDIELLESLRVKYLGKKGELTGILRQMGKLSAEERPVMGQLANQLRGDIEAAIEQRKAELGSKLMELKLEREAVDVTLPGETSTLGHKHPMYNVLDQIKDIFIGMGFEILDGPEVEKAEYNFTKLNIDEGHPSREWTDTFYFKDDSSILLRTQTSPMQIHAMETRPLPIRIVAESLSATVSWNSSTKSVQITAKGTPKVWLLTSDSYENTTYSYDSANRLLSKTGISGSYRYRYNAQDQIISETWTPRDRKSVV